MVLSGVTYVTYGNRANSPAPFRSDRKTPAIFRIAIAPIEDRSIEGRCRLSVSLSSIDKCSFSAAFKSPSWHRRTNERTRTGIEWTFWAIASCDVEQAAAGLPFLRLSFRVSDLSERRHSIPIPRLPSAWCARVPRTTCDVMFRSLFCLLCLGQLATPSPCACGRRKQRTTSKPANTISSVFITFQVRPQGTTRKEGRGRRPFSAGYFGKAGYLSCKRTANPLCHSEGLSATDRCHRYHRQRRARVVVSAGLDG